MDIDDFRSILESSGVDVWTFIDTAIVVASLDFGSELKRRRDDIVERLFAAPNSCSRCRDRSFNDINMNHTSNGDEIKGLVEKESSHEEEKGRRVTADSPVTPRSVNGDDDELDPYGGLFDDEPKKILDIKQQLEDIDQPEDSLVDLLQSLADMDITFQALKETDIGRHVNRLRKHSSNDVKRLVKQLVRKWKEIVDDWVRMNPQGEHASSGLMAYGDSPQQKIPQNFHHQVPDFAYSPNPHNGSSGSDRNNSEPERKPKPAPLRNQAPTKPTQKPVPASLAAPHNVQRQREQPKASNFDPDQRLASARKRLQANYKEAENAKKQRTIQVMDIHDIPKPKNKNTFFPKNRGAGGSHQGRHW
ncbi:mediator of RNA polymerase II transcription [Salix suchowensis]|nr:mediator of RNA polymerase II transcription [Salix suchowensis]